MQSNSMNKKGATFFGVMLATVIISLAVIPLVASLIDQTRMTRVSRARIFATHLAHNMLERMRLENYNSVKVWLDSPQAGELFIQQDVLLSPPDASAKYRQMLSGFKREMVFAEVNPRIGSLEAYVSWVEDGQSRRVRLATVLVDTNLPGGVP